MKILLVAKQWRGGLGRYYHLALNDMFPGQVEWVKTRPSTVPEHKIYRRSPEEWWQRLRRRIATSGHDVALFVGYHDAWNRLSPDTRNILYSIDNVNMKSGDLNGFSRIFISDPGYVSDLEAVCHPNQYGGVLPFACYPPIHRPGKVTKPSRDVVFIGNRDEKRDAILASLLRQPYSTTIYGNYFLNSELFKQKPWAFRPTINNDHMAKAYGRHKVAINIHASVVRAGTNMRSFECAAYGIPQVVEARPGIEDYFVPREEIQLFTTEKEMLVAIKFLLTEPKQSAIIAARARARVFQEHTYCHRIVALLKQHLPADVLDASFKKAIDSYAGC